MTGTLAGAVAARKIPTQPARLSAGAEGFVESVEGKPLVTRIKVRYTVRVPKGKRPDALRAIEVHERGCPASQSVQRGIAVEWDGDVRRRRLGALRPRARAVGSSGPARPGVVVSRRARSRAACASPPSTRPSRSGTRSR